MSISFTEQSVDLIDCYGTDLLVVDAARVSFAKKSERNPDGTLSEKDRRLIDYLAREKHWTPFAHPHATFRIKAPLFVARQLVKHQVGGVWSEESRRYIDSDPEFYMPSSLHSRPDGSIKQGAGDEIEECAEAFTLIGQVVMESAVSYKHLISSGVAPEEARMVLPLNTMTTWVWTGSLMFFARVCQLRLDSHAQSATREVAQKIADHMSENFPVSWKCLIKYRG